MIGRRALIAGLGGAAAAWPLAAYAQPRSLPVIGFLNGRTPEEWADNLAAFRSGLAEIGFDEGRNVAIEYRWAGGHYERLPVLAAELLQYRLAVIVASGGDNSVVAAKRATQTIAIVAVMAGDPVATGLIASLNRPAGNITGMVQFGRQLQLKRLEILHEMVPAATKVAFVEDPKNLNAAQNAAELEEAARSLGLLLRPVYCNTVDDIERTFAFRQEDRPGAMLVSGFPTFQVSGILERIIELAARLAVPVGFAWRGQAMAGGLSSYGTNIVAVYRQVGVYTGRILKGEKPGELPVMQPTTFELVVNLKTAKALGLTIPPTLLARADEVIE